MFTASFNDCLHHPVHYLSLSWLLSPCFPLVGACACCFLRLSSCVSATPACADTLARTQRHRRTGRVTSRPTRTNSSCISTGSVRCCGTRWGRAVENGKLAVYAMGGFAAAVAMTYLMPLLAQLRVPSKLWRHDDDTLTAFSHGGDTLLNASTCHSEVEGREAGREGERADSVGKASQVSQGGQV